MFVGSTKKSKNIIRYQGKEYKYAYATKHGDKYKCCCTKHCRAYLLLNENKISEVEAIHDDYEDENSEEETEASWDQNSADTALLIRSRKGKEIILFRQFTYRKIYTNNGRTRWTCTTTKNCRGVVFTDDNNLIISSMEDHSHGPPKYYHKKENVLRAIKQHLKTKT